jgi:altronate hydrolase
MQCIVINPKEDVVTVALEDLKKGQTVKTAQGNVTLKNDITRGHKFAPELLAEFIASHRRCDF